MLYICRHCICFKRKCIFFKEIWIYIYRHVPVESTGLRRSHHFVHNSEQTIAETLFYHIVENYRNVIYYRSNNPLFVFLIF